MAKFSEAILTQYGPSTRSTGIVPRVKTLTPSLAAPYHRLRSVANRPCAKARQHLLGTASFTQQTHVQAASDQCLQFIGNCERDSLKAHRSGSLSAHPINVNCHRMFAKDTVPFGVGRWYDFPEFGCHLGNVDPIGHPGSQGSYGLAAIRPWWPTIAFNSLKMSTHYAPDTVVSLVESVLIKAEPS